MEEKNRHGESMWELSVLALHCVFSGHVINVKNGIPIIQLNVCGKYEKNYRKLKPW